jgi:hypothetical protein
MKQEIKQFFLRVLSSVMPSWDDASRLVRLHPEVHCNYQAHFFTRQPLLKSLVDTPEAEEWLTRKSTVGSWGGTYRPWSCAAADFIMESGLCVRANRSWGQVRSPVMHGQAVGDLAALCRCRLIYLVRDGRDVLVSERFRNFVEVGFASRRIGA